MFDGAMKFTGRGGFLSWNTSSAINFSQMFKKAESFNSYSVAFLDVSNGEEFDGMFDEAESFNVDISFWRMPNAKDVRKMFFGAEAFSQDLCSWLEHLPVDAQVDGMFAGESGCPDKRDPVLPNGPMCVPCSGNSIP